MCKLKVQDFYYGAFLSALLNTSGSRPVLFDETGSRRIYRLDTNNMSECYVFTKFVTGKESDNKKKWHWTFNFSDSEIDAVQKLFQKSGKVKLALICAKKGLAESELAVIDYHEAIDCLGVNAGVKNYKIDIKTVDGKHGLKMYGSGRSDMINGKDNTLKISRKDLVQL